MTLQSLQHRGLHSSSSIGSCSTTLASSSSCVWWKEGPSPRDFGGDSGELALGLVATDIGRDEGFSGWGRSPACCRRIIGQEDYGHATAEGGGVFFRSRPERHKCWNKQQEQQHRGSRGNSCNSIASTSCLFKMPSRIKPVCNTWPPTGTAASQTTRARLQDTYIRSGFPWQVKIPDTHSTWQQHILPTAPCPREVGTMHSTQSCVTEGTQALPTPSFGSPRTSSLSKF